MSLTQLSRLALLLTGLAGSSAFALEVPIALVDADGSNKNIGHILIEARPYGTLLTPALKDLPPGLHGFHLHENPSCAPAEKDGKKTAALGAGGHLDPARTGKHEGPYGQGHLGDLPALYVAADGTATQAVLAPRLKPAEFTGHSLMIHAGGDNHSDHPQALGGGGSRIACGVVR